MTIRRAQTVLFGIVLAALLVTLGALGRGYLEDQFFSNELNDLIKQTLLQFAGPLSIILGSFFASQASQALVSRSALFFAVGCVLLWGSLIAARTLLFVVSSDEMVPVLVKWNADVVVPSGFLVNGVLAYFFSSAWRSER
jgi:uncharacterized membrane protein YgdD (TMEM256/DUF423 family)